MPLALSMGLSLSTIQRVGESLPPPEWITADTASGGLTITEDVLNSSAPVASSPEVEHILIGTAPETTGPTLQFTIGSFTGVNYPITLTIGEDNPPVLVKGVIALTSLGAITAPQARDGLAGDGTAGEAFEFTRSTNGVENINTADLPAGDYTMALVGIDKFGNKGPVATDSLVVAASSLGDDFNRADELLTDGADWTQVETSSGRLSIVNNVVEMSKTGSAREVATYNTQSGANDYFVEVETTITSLLGNNRVQIRFAFTDIDNNYFVELRGNGSLRLYRVQAGATTQLSAPSVTIASNAVLRAEIENVGGDQTLRIFYNGSQEISLIDDNLTPAQTGGTGINLASGAAVDAVRLDNFSIGPL